jgi:hypothetical protein
MPMSRTSCSAQRKSPARDDAASMRRARTARLEFAGPLQEPKEARLAHTRHFFPLCRGTARRFVSPTAVVRPFDDHKVTACGRTGCIFRPHRTRPPSPFDMRCRAAIMAFIACCTSRQRPLAGGQAPFARLTDQRPRCWLQRGVPDVSRRLFAGPMRNRMLSSGADIDRHTSSLHRHYIATKFVMQR